MKTFAALSAALFVWACAHAPRGEPPAASRIPEPPPWAGFLVENGTYDAELFLPLDVFHHTPFHANPGLRVCLVAPSHDPIRTFEGVEVRPDFSYDDAPPLEVLVVPSAERHVRPDFDDPRLLAFVRERAGQARFVVSLCDGAFVLARAGLLDGRFATTYPGDRDALADRFPSVRVVRGVDLCVDGPFVTGSGGARSALPALFVVDRLFGRSAARGVARGLVERWEPGAVRLFEAQSEGRAYRPGDRIDPRTRVFDEAGRETHPLADCDPGTRAVLLCVFGGGDPSGRARRGGLWCEDSFHELPLLHHVRARFGPRGLRLVGVACPPVFDLARFGYVEPSSPGDADALAENLRRLVDSTRAADALAPLPFDRLLFDARFALLGEPRLGEAEWHGRLRADGETQRYGTPTLWLLSPQGEVLAPPFFGNNAEKPVPLRYTARELDEAIAEALGAG